MTPGLETITAGFLPLLDSVLLIAAKEKGFIGAEGLTLDLVRESSWANIRDRLGVGHFDVAHMLAPMPIAANLGLNPLPMRMIAPLAMGLGGNAVTVGLSLWSEMKRAGASGDLAARPVGEAMRRVIATRTNGPLRFGVVHPHSGHNYELRYWLAASGIVPDEEVEIVIMPPALLPDALEAGSLDGFCVGAPWNSVAVTRGVGRIVAIKASIWRSSPEKVLGLTEAWADQNPEKLAALLRALYKAAEWCGDPSNHEEAAALLGRPEYLAQPASILLRALSGKLLLGDLAEQTVPDFYIPHARAATFPWTSHALWFYSQMVRWGQVSHSPANAQRASTTYRPDIYRGALAPLGVAMPSASAKVEGALREPTPVGATRGTLTLGPDGFFDGQIFDPTKLEAYLSSQATSHSEVKR